MSGNKKQAIFIFTILLSCFFLVSCIQQEEVTNDVLLATSRLEPTITKVEVAQSTNTPRSEPTPRPRITPRIKTSLITPIPSPTIRPSPAPWPSITPLPRVRILSNPVDLRMGPSTNYPSVGIAQPNDILILIAKNQDGSWLLIQPIVGESGWVNASSVRVTVGTLDNVRTDTISSETQSSFTTCSCSGNTLNCDDFSTHNDAQVCYDYCMLTVGYDVHDLDRDNDGSACE